MKRLLLLLLLPLGAILLLAGCGEDDEPTRNNDFVPLTAITVTSDSIQVPAGFTNRFTATGDFSGAFSRPITSEATWASSNPAILVFDDPNSGIGRGVAPGAVTVTASRNGVTGALDFTVSDATLQSIAIEPAAPSIPKGTTQQFIATGTFTDGSTRVITPDVAWTSANPAILTVDAGGLATAVAEGGPIQVSAGFPKDASTVSDTATVTVTAPTIQSVTVEPAIAVITTTETQQFTATARFSDNTAQTVTTTATWASSAPTVATIGTNTGLATAVALGTTNITATFSGVESTPAVLTVATLESIEVTPTTGNIISLGDPSPTLQLTALGRFTGVAGTQDITGRVEWTSNNLDVATVGATTGLVQGIGPGTATIRATKDGRTGSVSVTVQP